MSLPNLPSTWEWVRLNEICTIGAGDGAPQGDKYFENGHVPFVRTQDVSNTNGMLIKKTKNLVNELALNEFNLRKWPVQSLLIPKSGASALLNNRALLSQESCVVSHLAVLVPTENVLPEFIYYWSTTFDSHRVIPDTSYPSIRLQDLSRVLVPLPPATEQKQIAELLRQVESIVSARDRLIQLFDALVLAAYWETFGHYYTNDGIKNEVRLGSFTEQSQYGLSESMDLEGSHAILRMNNITSSGWLDLADLKYVTLSEADHEVYDLKDGDLLFNRTNSKELVGKTAIWRIQKDSFTFASYLIRLRLKPGLLPEYVWATLNSAYGKYRLFNMAKQAVSMANISASDITRFALPKPTLEEQRRFAALVRELEGLRDKLIVGKPQFMELVQTAAIQALLGELTERWRNDNIKTLRREAEERRRRGFKTLVKPIIETPGKTDMAETGIGQENRIWLLNQLSPLQRRVLKNLPEFCVVHFTTGSPVDSPLSRFRPLPVDDADALREFCEALAADGEAVATDHVRRALDQLSALGLIAKVSILAKDEEGAVNLSAAYRPLRDDERSQMIDLVRLEDLLRQGNQA